MTWGGAQRRRVKNHKHFARAAHRLIIYAFRRVSTSLQTASRERMRSGPRWLWLGVAWMVHDCVASIRAVPEVEMPERERGSSSGGNSGGSRDASGVLAVLVDKFSLRFFKFQRGELVVLRCAFGNECCAQLLACGSHAVPTFASLSHGVLTTLPACARACLEISNSHLQHALLSCKFHAPLAGPQVSRGAGAAAGAAAGGG